MKELQDQVRDLMFYLETQKKIADTPEEMRQVRPQWPAGADQEEWVNMYSVANTGLLALCFWALPNQYTLVALVDLVHVLQH